LRYNYNQYDVEMGFKTVHWHEMVVVYISGDVSVYFSYHPTNAD